MRTITTAQQAVLDGDGRAEYVRVSVKDAGGTYRDLTTYPGVNMLKRVSWEDTIDNPSATCDVVLTREQDYLSLAPLMAASPLNLAFTPGGSANVLLALHREMKVEWAIVPADTTPAAGDWTLGFHGYVDEIEVGSGSDVLLHCRDLGGYLMDLFIEKERAYGLAEDTVHVGARIWSAGATFATGEYCIPTDGKLAAAQYVYKCTAITTGTTGTAEPAWPTTLTNTVVDSGVTWTCQVAIDNSGYPVEEVMQAIITNNLPSGSLTLYVPSSPSWDIKQFKQQREGVLTALRTLAQQLGWECRYKWKSGDSDFALTLYEPDRSAAAPGDVVHTFSASDYSDVTQAAVRIDAIRNVIRVIYSNSADLDSSGNPRRAFYEATDSTSVTAYGRRFMEIAESSSSQIDTSAEATLMATAALNDLSEPVLEHSVALVHGFPWAEVGDFYTFTANQRHYSADQSLALASFRHTAEGGRIRTELTCRGKPALGVAVWADKDSRNGETHEVQSLQTSDGITLSTASVVGGGRIFIENSPRHGALPDEYEVHLSTSASFTASTSTLQCVTRARSVELSDLLPGTTYYAAVVPRAFNGQKLITGYKSTESSFVAGRAQAGHINSELELGRMPLNGSFETWFDTGGNPDYWTGSVATFQVQTDANGISGRRYAKLTSVALPGYMESALFSVQTGKRYRLTLWANGSLNNFTFTAGLRWYTQAAVYDSASSTVSIPSNTAAWTEFSVIDTAPANARLALVRVSTPGYVSAIFFDEIRVEEWHEAPSGVSYYGPNSWADYGGSYQAVEVYIDRSNRAHLRGCAAGGTLNATAFILGTAYRPSAQLRFAADFNGTHGVVLVQTNGNVDLYGSDNTIVSLDGISWLVGE